MIKQTIPLTKQQKEIMSEFYRISCTKVIYDKKERNDLWHKAIKRVEIDFDAIKEKCPALEHQIKKSYDSGNNIQPAVFSECVYAQTFANMMKLTEFIIYSNIPNYIPSSVDSLLKSYHLVPRYVYSTKDKRRMLIQAGGCDGIDSALITVIDLVIYTIEFKEPGAKTSEPDLPKYKEDGLLVITKDWLLKNSQFEAMLNEQKGLNFFDIMGRNINNFSKNSIEIAVSNNYANKKKFADVICTEDKKGNLVMLPTNQVSHWAKLEGEIRPAGRNHYKVWTPKALQKFLLQKGASFNGDIVTISKENLEIRKERGGNNQISGYKVTPLFFIYVKDCTEYNGVLTFDINKMQQLNPTIAGKMFFNNLMYEDVKKYYDF